MTGNSGVKNRVIIKGCSCIQQYNLTSYNSMHFTKDTINILQSKCRQILWMHKNLKLCDWSTFAKFHAA